MLTVLTVIDFILAAPLETKIRGARFAGLDNVLLFPQIVDMFKQWGAEFGPRRTAARSSYRKEEMAGK